MLVALLGTTSPARAEPQVSLDNAADGTMVLVGSGWRPGQRMVVSVGRDQFAAVADSVGDFEVATGLVATGAPEQLAVHEPAQSAPLFVGQAPQADPSSTLAVLLAQSLMNGTVCLALSAGSLGLVALAMRSMNARRGSSLKKP